MSIADLLVVGDRVEVRSIDGFAGFAVVREVRDSPGCRCKVRMDDDNPPPFWAHDFELFPIAAADGTDSRPATLAHIAAVRGRLGEVIRGLVARQAGHDLTKLADPEKAAFDEFTPKLRATTYGSDEYRGFLAATKPALDHHYAHNSHHPEHGGCDVCVQCGRRSDDPCTCGGPRRAGVDRMCLLDLIEMLADWKAATGRHADGDLAKSIALNQTRFGYSDDLKATLTNTAQRMGWL